MVNIIKRLRGKSTFHLQCKNTYLKVSLMVSLVFFVINVIFQELNGIKMLFHDSLKVLGKFFETQNFGENLAFQISSKKKFYNIDYRPNLFNFSHFERTTLSRLNCPSYLLKKLIFPHHMTQIVCLESNPRPQQFLTHLASSLFCFFVSNFPPKKIIKRCGN